MNETKNLEQKLKSKKRKRRWAIVGAFAALTGFVSISTPLLTACSSNSQFSIGNFQSYMNPVVQNYELPNAFGNLNYIYYGTNYEIPNHIYNKSVNLTIATDNMVSALAYHKLIKKYDWSKFGLEDPETHTLITNVNQLQSIFTPMAWAAATAYSDLFKKYLHIDNFNLLEYAIPYFLQNIVFCYRGPEIPQLPPNHTSYYQIFKYITEWNEKENAYVPGHPYNRFIKPGVYHRPKLMMVQSPRTDFDIANIVRQEEILVKQGVKPEDLWKHDINVNPEEGLLGMPADKTPSIDWFTNVLNTLVEFFKPFPNAINFNTNSSPIINALALNQINGGFIYNGDSVYTMQGGSYSNDPNANINITNDNIHVVMPYNNLLAMDNIVMNSANSESEDHLAYKIAYQLGLSGSMLYENTPYNQPIGHEPQNVLHVQPDITKQVEIDGSMHFAYVSMANFNWVDYTPELKTIYAYASKKGPNGYFMQDPDNGAGPGLTSEALANKSIWALDMQSSVSPSNYHFEMPLNDLANSNLGIAFVTFMNNM